MVYEELKQEIRTFLNDFTASGLAPASLVGWKVMYSPHSNSHRILLCGINPGGGEEGDQLDKPFERLEYFDHSYTLANETHRLFQLMDLSHLLENETAKTNCYYYTTKSLKGLDDVITAINKYYASISWKYKSHYEMLFNWNHRLILDIFQPRIIICEGKRAYQFMDMIYHPDNGWTEMQRYDGVSGYWQHTDGRIIFGYSRMQSRIRDKEKVAERLKPLLLTL